ncbi:MAG: pyridoxamine 5'-phosphate oxidase family protein [Thermoanaerobaculia bacterium]
MAFSELTPAGIETFLDGQRVVRLCFSFGGSQYLLPVGYAWMDGYMHLMLAAGKKTAMLRANPRVAFQVDDSAERGMLDWSSVTGEGEVDIVEERSVQARIAIALLARFPELAQWGEEEARKKEGSMLFARIRPQWMTGRRFAVLSS